MSKKSKRKRARQKNSETETASSPKTKKFIGLACAVVLGAGLYALFGPGGMLTGADPDDEKLVALGEGVYRDNCASCHGANLEGQPDWRARNADGTLKAPPHDETGHTWHHPDADMFRYTKSGGQALAPSGFKSAMPGFAETLSDDDIWAVLSFIHSRWPAKIRERQSRINTRAR